MQVNAAVIKDDSNGKDSNGNNINGNNGNNSIREVHLYSALTYWKHKSL
jgi:hypothetical protein